MCSDQSTPKCAKNHTNQWSYEQNKMASFFVPPSIQVKKNFTVNWTQGAPKMLTTHKILNY